MEIIIKDLHFSYGTSQILRNIHLNISNEGQGKIIGLIGPNGAGKSTLLKCMARMHNKTDSHIAINGKLYADFSKQEFLDTVAYSPQDTSTNSHLSAFEIVLLSYKCHGSWRTTEQDLQKVSQIFVYLGIEEFAMRSINTLSGGQQQLVFMAKSLACYTPILLLDEATSALDIHHQLKVLNILKQWCKNNRTIIIMAMHDLQLVSRFSDEIVAMDTGQVYLHSTVESVMTAEMLRDVYKVSADVFPNRQGMLSILPLAALE